MYNTAQVSTGEILVLCAGPDHWVMTQLGENYNLFQLDDFKAVVNSLTSIQYELIILDDSLLGSNIHSVITDVRRQFHMLPIIVYTDRIDIDYHEQLASAGANGTISPNLEPQQLQLQIQLMLAQYSRDRTLIAYTRKLHSITYLPRLLDNATDPQTVIAQLVRLLGSLLNTCGVAVVLKEASGLRLYAGATDINSTGTLHQANYPSHKRDPFLWTLTSGHSQIYQDISVHAHYVPLPGFPKHLSAAIVPLIFQNEKIGALGIFSPVDIPVKHEDLVIYDQIAFQLATFLRYASMYENKHVMNQANVSLLEAWDTLASLHTANEVINALCDLIKSLLPVSSVMIWLTNQSDSGNITEFWTNPEAAGSDGVEIDQNALARELEQMVDPDLTTVAAGRNVQKGTQLDQLMTSLSAKQILVRPITMGNQIVGGTFITISDSESVNWSERYIFDNLARIGESVVERTVLNEAVYYGHALLTAILASISEGIFFVNNSNKLAYLTPQVQELTRLDSPITIGSDSQFVLQAIADKTNDPTQAFARLWSAAMAANDMRGDTFAFTSASLSPYELDIDIEFLPVGRNARESTGWIGVVRNSSRTKRADLFKGLLSKLRAPFTQVRNLVSALAEEHGQLSYGDRDQMLREIYGAVENAGQKWEVLSDVFNLQFDTIEMNRDSVKLQDLMHRIINSHAFSASQWRINIVNDTPLANVTLDEFYAKRAITYLLRRALSQLSDQTPLNIRIEQNAREVCLVFEDNRISLTNEQIAKFSDPSAQIADIQPNDLSLFIARELLRKNSGRMWIENNPQQKTVITIAFPATATAVTSDESIAAPAAAKPRVIDTAAMIGRPAPIRGFRSVMLVEGESILIKRLRLLIGKQEVDTLVYESAEEAFIDLNSTLLDLIIIDGRLREGKGVEICQKMRRSTEVPIILVYDSASASEKVEGLNSGADEIITEPISDEELLARIRAITKRQQIADRSSEPLIINDLQIDLSRREVFIAGNPVELTRIEYDLLNTMIMNRNQVLTHKQLLTKVWGPEYLDETQYLWVNISRLRKKLEPTPNSTRYIRTQPGVGYYFAADKK